jgi:predicted Zn finger-like uncharacterized protein
MRLTCPTCGARYEVAEGLVDPGGQHVQCTACHARWFERPPGRAAGQRLSEDEIIARLDQRAGGPPPRPGGPTPDRTPAGPIEGPTGRSPELPNVAEQETAFRWERRGEEGVEPRPPAGHLRVVGGGSEAKRPASRDEAASPMPRPVAAAPPAAAEGEGRRPDAAGAPPQTGGDRPARPADQPTAPGETQGTERPHRSGADLRPSRQARPASAGGDGARRKEPSPAASARRLDLVGAEPVQREPPRPRRRASGFVIALVLLGLLAVLYAAAEPLARIAPWVSGPIEGYVTVVNGIRGEGEARLGSIAETLRGLLSDGD